MARPSKLPIWNTSEANATEPPSSRQTDGWAITAGVPEKPPVEWHNYIWNLQYKWIDYLDTEKADKSGVSLTVDNVFELSEELASASTTAIVKDTDRGGVFVYDASQSGVNNGGTIFNGWVRQYDGSVNVKWFGAKGDGITDDTSAIQSAINYANSKNGLNVLFGKGIFVITSPILIDNGIVIQGLGTGTPASSKGVSVIKAGANMTEMIKQRDDTKAGQPFTIKDISIHGNKANYSVDKGIALRGRSIRIDSCNISDCSGIGLHLMPTIFDPSLDLAWVNWVTNCNISRNSGYGVKVECSDSFFTGNYFTNNLSVYQKTSGGNVWSENHFDVSSIGLEVYWDEGWYNWNEVAPRTSNRITNNYFDNNITGLKIDGTTTLDSPSRAKINSVISENIFRANNLHIDFISLINVEIGNTSLVINADKASEIDDSSPLLGLGGGIRFDNCSGGVLNSVSFDKGYTYPSDSLVSIPTGTFQDTIPMFIGKPSNTKVSSSNREDTGGTSPIFSERSGVATVASDTNEIVVNHRLFDAPLVVSITQRAGQNGVFYNHKVKDINQTSFTIEVDSDVTANQSFNWSASLTQ